MRKQSSTKIWFPLVLWLVQALALQAGAVSLDREQDESYAQALLAHLDMDNAAESTQHGQDRVRRSVDENGNINCRNCSNCYNCRDCDNCSGCNDCSNCKSCSECKNCFNSHHCSSGHDLQRCGNCSGCGNCRNCNNCSYCNNSSNINNRSYCDNCHGNN